MADFEAIRRQFPILGQQVHGRPLVYLDSAATAQKPQAVIDAESGFYESINAGVHRGAHELAARSTVAFEDARAAMARFVGASAEEGREELMVTAGATAGLNLLATAFGYASMGRGPAAAQRFALGPGDEIVVIAPFFPEYRMWIENAGCTCVLSPACQDTMYPDLADLPGRIGPKTRAVIINSPNNPTGAVYPRDVLEGVADILRRASEANGRTIYLIADEPYREIAYADVEVPWVPAIYENTVVCYSWSKSLSLPGERIGYVLVPNTMPAHKEVYAAICGAGRALGYVCAPAIVQKVVEKCCTLPSDVAAYATNRDILLTGLRGIGYECVEPEGAFYLWVRALEPDAQAFSVRARDNHELLLVPSDSFGMTGWVRISYCVAKETIENSLPAFKALFDEYQG